MRLVSVLWLCLFVASFNGCQSSDRKGGPVSNVAMVTKTTDSATFTTLQWMDSTDKNFGKIAEGQKLEVAFHFKNSGDHPLIIEKVQPSCGCTVAEQPTEPVAPGNEGVIKASFNSEGRVGPNHKTLFVYANTKGTTSHELKFEVEVEKKKW
jgi:Protein of unknown function (DUF1573)